MFPASNQSVCYCSKHLTTIATQVPTSGFFAFETLVRLGQLLRDRRRDIENCEDCATKIQARPLTPIAVAISNNILRLCEAAAATYDLLSWNGNGGSAKSHIFNDGDRHVNEYRNNMDQDMDDRIMGGGGTLPQQAVLFNPPLTNKSGTEESPAFFDMVMSAPVETATCVKSRMALGKLELQYDEAVFLVRRIIYTVLTELSTVLRIVNIRDNKSQTRTRSNSAQCNRSDKPGNDSNAMITHALSQVLSLLGKLSG